MRVGLTPILRGVDLDLMPGEIVGLVGPNGSGKTTLLRILATLIQPREGSGRVLGADLDSEDRYDVRPRIGLIGHTPGLYPTLTVEENTAFAAGMLGKPQESVLDVLDRVGLAGVRDRLVSQCSHGMQRRAEFARILLTTPDLLLLDEAHAGLDRQSSELVPSVVRDVRSRDGAAVLVSHNPDRIDPLIDRMLHLEAGELGVAP